MENAVVGVRRSLTRSGGRVVFDSPKTKKSHRSIRLTPQAVEALRSHLKRQLRDMEILGDHYQDQGLVFTTDKGGPINPSNLRQRSFAPLLKRAGLPHQRFRDLRHTCATLLLSRGVHPKFVQELLGHATIAITLDTYSHVIPSMGAPPQKPWKTRSPKTPNPGCRQMVVKKASDIAGAFSRVPCLPAKCDVLRVGLPGLKPGTSSLSEKQGHSWCILPRPIIDAFMPFSANLALPFFCSVRLSSGQVAARLLHTEHARQDSSVRPSNSDIISNLQNTES